MTGRTFVWSLLAFVAGLAVLIVVNGLFGLRTTASHALSVIGFLALPVALISGPAYALMWGLGWADPAADRFARLRTRMTDPARQGRWARWLGAGAAVAFMLVSATAAWLRIGPGTEPQRVGDIGTVTILSGVLFLSLLVPMLGFAISHGIRTGAFARSPTAALAARWAGRGAWAAVVLGPLAGLGLGLLSWVWLGPDERGWIFIVAPGYLLIAIAVGLAVGAVLAVVAWVLRQGGPDRQSGAGLPAGG